MNTPAPIQIFKPGRHTAMSGAVLEFSESDLQAASTAYDPALHEAPIVVGHPKLDAPAYGWVRALQFADGGLSAEPDQVDPEFAELVKAGRFKKVSASFFSPDSPRNPVPGVYYLRHVGFLGAVPPAVKGLKQVEFAADDEGVIEFSAGDWQTSSIFRRLRDWMIAQFGQETADEVIPSWEIDSIREMAVREEAREIGTRSFAEKSSKGEAGDGTGADVRAEIKRLRDGGLTLEDISTELDAISTDASRSATTLSAIVAGEIANPPESLLAALKKIKKKSDEFSEQPSKGDEMSAEDKARLAALEEENTQLKAAQESQRVAGLHAANVSFADGLVADGRLLPTNKAVTVATLDMLAQRDEPYEFGEGDDKVAVSLDNFKAMLQGFPKVVDFSEHAAGGSDAEIVNFSAPQGYSTDPAALETHSKAVAHQAANPGMTYIDAVKAVSK